MAGSSPQARSRRAARLEELLPKSQLALASMLADTEEILRQKTEQCRLLCEQIDAVTSHNQRLKAALINLEENITPRLRELEQQINQGAGHE